MGTYYNPESTRPLSIVNTDNRLVANAARLRWEGVLQDWVSEHQQGFLPGRSILSNLIAIDAAAMETALEHPRGAIILFDFKAAFPSIAPEYLFEALRHMGLPQNAINFVTSLYDRNMCQVSYKGQQYEGFGMTSGVRQGCPLSPLLYAIAADALLEKVSALIPDAVVRAYADDTAVVLTDFWSQAPLLAHAFDEFGNLSNLRLNHKKCVIIPLNPRGLTVPEDLAPTTSNLPMDPLEKLQQDLRIHLPIWGRMSIEWTGTYLGFVVGPGKGDESWRKPVAKYTERCSLWAGHGHGLQYNAMTYNTFAMSTLSYVAQLEVPPDWVRQHERDMLRKVAAGPRDWVKAEDLWHLNDAYGLPRSFTCLQWLAPASKLRAYLWDPATADERHVRRISTQVRGTIDCPSMPYTKVVWREWFDRCFILQLQKNYHNFVDSVCSTDEIISMLAGTTQRPLHTEVLATVKANFQHAAYEKICHRHAYDPEFRIRYKQSKWKLNDRSKHAHVATTARKSTPAWQASRSLHNIRLLASLCTPRVQAAVLSTIFNRWTTARRFQQRGSSRNVCVFRCSPTAEDSLEHYARCRCVRELASRHLRLDPDRQVNMHCFNLCSPTVETQEDPVASAILIYATYRATNHLRQHADQGCFQPGGTFRMLQQFAREGALNHRVSTGILDRRWSNAASRTPISATVPTQKKRRQLPPTQDDTNPKRSKREAATTPM